MCWRRYTMPRLIDADIIRQEWLENGENEYVYDTNDVLDSIDAQPTVNRWNPVTERMPPVNEKIGIFTKSRRIYIGRYTERNGIAYTRCFITEEGLVLCGSVTHWMPLPDAPEEDEDA